MKQRLLIVDDSKMNREMLKEILTDAYDFVEAENGKEAIDIIETNIHIDLMLLDIHMPVMDGYEVLEIMNRKNWINKIPVIMISAEESNKSMTHCYELGIIDYVPRPFNALIVERRVQNTLQLYADQKELAQMVKDQITEKEENNSIMIQILSHTVETRNHESGDHINNIRLITNILLKYIVRNGNPYKISESQMALIVTASALHDIGKNSIPDSILNKVGRLTDEEFDIMRTHTILGASFIEQAANKKDKPLFKIAKDVCRWHHERWDGKGYPDGLKEDEIPIWSQIVSLADVYDALTSVRCYKGAYDHETAMKMILNGECGAFNPVLLNCLKEAENEIKEADFSTMEEELDSHIKAQIADEIFRNTPLLEKFN